MELLELHDDLGIFSFKSGQTIWFQGDKITQIGIVVSGRLNMTTLTFDGQTVWIDEMSPGDLIGLEVFTDTSVSTCEIVAERDTKVVYLNKAQLMQGLIDKPAALERLLKTISSKLINLNQRIVEANTLSAKGRICAELKRQSKSIGIDPGSHIIRPTPIFTEFALRVGSTRETVSRTINRLVNEDILIRKTGALVIPNMERLEDSII